MSLSLWGSNIDQLWRELIMSPLYPERTIIAILSVASACHPCKLCLLKKMIWAGKEPDSKCEVEGVVWREGEKLLGESWLGWGSAQSVTVADKICCVKCSSGPCWPRIPGEEDFGSVGARAGNRKWILCSVSVTLVPVMVFPFLTHVSLSKPLFFMQVV